MDDKQDPSHPLPNGPEIRELIKRAKAGDPDILPDLRRVLDSHPEVWQSVADLARHAIDAQVNLAAGQDHMLRQSLGRQLDAMKQELGHGVAGPLERLLIDRVLVTWVQAWYADAMRTASTDVDLRQAQFLEARSARAHRAHMSAIKSLATVRKTLAATGRTKSTATSQHPAFPTTAANKR
jgi:hypothetical protein